MSLRLTNSEMTTFRRCKRKWYLGTYRQLGKPESVAGNPLAIGTRVHNGLAAYYLDNSCHPAVALRAGVEQDIVDYPFEAEQLRKDLDLCDAMLTGYIEWLEETGIDSDIRVIAPETKIEVALFDDVTLLSKLDARVERISTGTRLALEFKTAQSLTAPLPTLQIDSQLLTEHLVEFLALCDSGSEADAAASRAQGVLYRMMRKVKRTATAKPPFYAEEEVLHNLDELRNHWRHVVAIAREIVEATRNLDNGGDPHTYAYPSARSTCSWDCNFLDACKLMDAGAGADPEGYIAENFIVRDPLARYKGVDQVEESW